MARSIGFLSTYPPTHCGLATFNSALVAHLRDERTTGVVRVVTGIDDVRPGPDVVHTWPAARPGGWRAAADALNAFDVAVVQHEYGIYPGADGEDVAAAAAPARGAQHRRAAHRAGPPDAPARSWCWSRSWRAADAVVTMTGTARDRLLAGYPSTPAKVTVIPHGAAEPRPAPPRRPRAPRPHLLTWGLLGPGKGIEWALRALARLRDLDPTPDVHRRRAGPTPRCSSSTARRTATGLLPARRAARRRRRASGTSRSTTTPTR